MNYHLNHLWKVWIQHHGETVGVTDNPLFLAVKRPHAIQNQHGQICASKYDCEDVKDWREWLLKALFAQWTLAKSRTDKTVLRAAWCVCTWLRRYHNCAENERMKCVDESIIFKTSSITITHHQQPWIIMIHREVPVTMNEQCSCVRNLRQCESTHQLSHWSKQILHVQILES